MLKTKLPAGRELSGRLAEAEAILEKLLKINPNYALGWSNLSQVKLQLGDRADAMADSRHAVELDRDDDVLNSWLSQLLTKISKVKGARH